MLKVYLVQMESRPDQVAENLAKAKSLIGDAHPQEGSLILLPEMFATGYLPKEAAASAQEFSKDNPGEVAQFLGALAKETHCTIFGGSTAKRNGAYTNHTGIFTPESDGEADGYDKIHPFFPELDQYTAGGRITLFKVGEFTVAPSICFDLRFPEQYRAAMKAGADLLTVQAAWPAVRKDHWEALLKARAIENQCYVAAVNCVSADNSACSSSDCTGNGTKNITDKVYTGDSRIISPLGEILVEAPAGRECVVSADLLIEPLRNYRHKFPVSQITDKFHT